MFADGATIRLFDVMPGLGLVFVGDSEGRCVYAGSVPWARRGSVRLALQQIGRAYHGQVLHAGDGR